MATHLCFSVEYRHSSKQLMVSMLRLGNLPPRFHSNVTLVDPRLLLDDRRPRQAKARGTVQRLLDFSGTCLKLQRCVRKRDMFFNTERPGPRGGDTDKTKTHEKN